MSSVGNEERAVITLQIGNYSNYIGAHFWNIQEAGFVFPSQTNIDYVPDINNSILFREGATGNSQNVGQPTYTPRLVSVDLKGALGSLPLYGDLYNDELSSVVSLNKSDSAPIWAGEVKIEKEKEKRKNEFLRHLEAEDVDLESARKKQKGERNSIILEDQDKDVCEYEEQENSQTSKQTYEQYKKIYDLDNHVNAWSDYLSARFHPRTNVAVEGYIHGDMRARPFDVFGLGLNYDDLTETIEDRIRFFAEEADYLRGFHTIVDSNNSFGGVGSKISELLADEYSTKTKVAFPCVAHNELAHQGGNSGIHNLSQFLNTALTLKNLSGTCSLLTPMSLSKDTFPLKNNFRQLPLLNYQPQNHYHTSAILASAIDTVTLPWRSRRNKIDMSEVLNQLNLNGRKVAATAISLPLPLRTTDFFVEFLEEIESKIGEKDGNFHEKTNLMSLTPGVNNVTKNIQMESLSLRGISVKERLKPKRDMRSNKLPAYTGRFAMTDSVPEALFSHFDKMKEIGKRQRVIPKSITSVDTSLPTGCPFPHIFDKTKISSSGFLLEDTADNSARGVNSVPVLTSLQSSHEMGLSIKNIAGRCGKINLNKLHRFRDAGLENDELLETTEELINLYECYEEDTIC